MHHSKHLSIILSLIMLIGVVFGFTVSSYADEEPENSVNLTVGENIVSHFYLDAAAYESMGGTKFFYSYNNGDTREKSEIVSEIATFEEAKNSDGKVQIDVAQAAAQIAEPITVEILGSNNEKVDSVTYTAKSYCDNVINMNDSALLPYTSHPSHLRTLCKAIIAYGKSAQGIFVDYMAKEGSVDINEDYSDELNFDSASYSYSLTKTDGNISFKSVSFMCESTAKMRFYFAPIDSNDSTNYGNPEVSAPFSTSWSKGVDTSGTFNLYIQIDNIAPADFNTPITVNYAGASISMSVLDYAGMVIATPSTTAQLKTLAKSLIRYNEAADNFFSAPATVYVPAKEATCTEEGWIAHYELGVKSYSDADAQTEIDPATPTIPHTEGAWEVQSGASLTSGGTEVKHCTVCSNQTSSRNVGAFTFNLPNTDSYLYRVGNSNAVSLGTFFGNESGASISGISVTTVNYAGNASCTYTANTSDWRNSTLKFNNMGVITVTLKHGATTVKSFKLEVVAGTNVTGGNLSNITSNNTVLLGDVTVNKITMNNGKTLYANGFTVTDQMAATNNNTSGYINMSGGASIDNAKLIGYECTSQVTAGVTNKDYAPGIRIDGDANIFNSYVSGRKNAVEIHSGKVNIVNSTIDGGAISNVQVVSGNLTLENCITTRTTRGTKTGLGIWLGSASSAKLNIKGTLKQYNLITNNEIPSDYQSVVSGVYNDNNFAYTYDGKKYVNMGILCMDTSGSIEEALAKTMINDERDAADISKYAYTVQGLSSLKGTLFTTTSANNAELVDIPEYQITGQYYTQPTHSFDYTTKNYQANSGGNTYCYYSDATGLVNISFAQGSSKSWDPMILTASKNNTNLSYTVSMNGVDYTDKNITFTESGRYQVEYTFTDPYNYDKNGDAFEHTYKEYVDIYVTAVDVEEVSYPAAFSYVGNYSNSALIKTINNETYVMPDVSATSDYIASTTVKDSDNSNVTVYCPVVTVNPTTSNGGTYSSGDAYFYAPAFSAINITDYNQSTGAAQYTYNSSSTTWPHAKSATAGPDTAIFGCPGVDGGLSYNGGNSPFRSDQSNNGVYSFKRVANAGGLVFSTNAISNNKTARNVTLKFHYTSNEGKTYYYYIKYVFPEFTYTSGGSCLAEGTQITMADGSLKAIEDVKQGEEIKTWNFFKGEYETNPVLIKYDHGVDNYEIVNLNFSDGTTQKVIAAHGFFDMDENKTVYLSAENAKDYIGHKFAKCSESGAQGIELVSYSVSDEKVGSYSIVSANSITAIANDMITVSNEIVDNLYEYFEVGDNLKYDEEKMKSDIEQYGLYTYDDFKDYISEELYEAFNGRYYKVLVGKGLLTFDDILYMIEYYVYPYETI